jgi:hypothetical protein
VSVIEGTVKVGGEHVGCATRFGEALGTEPVGGGASAAWLVQIQILGLVIWHGRINSAEGLEGAADA